MADTINKLKYEAKELKRAYEQKIYDIAKNIYEQGGQYEVMIFAHDLRWRVYNRCVPCNDTTPTVARVCMVCGTSA